MILISLTLKNYKQYTDLYLEFKQGLVGISGKNGAGKSTIFEAVLWALFGRDEDPKTFIRSEYASEDNVSITLEFEIQGLSYVVLRELRGKTLKAHTLLYQNQTLIAKDGAVNGQIQKLLHMDKSAFKNSVFSGQKELDELSKTKGSERKIMIGKILGIDRLDKIRQHILSDSKTLKDQIKGQSENLVPTSEIEQKKGQVQELQKSIENHTILVESSQKIRIEKEKEIEDLYKNRTKIEEKYQKFNEKTNEITRFDDRIKELQKSLLEATTEEKTLEENKKQIFSDQPTIEIYLHEKKELEKAEATFSLVAEKDKWESLKKQFQQQLLKVEEKISQNSNITSEKVIVESKSTILEQSIQENDIQLKVLEQRMVDFQKKINEILGQIKDRELKLENLKKLGKESNCPTCFRPLIEMYDQTLGVLTHEITEAQTQISIEYQQKVENLNVQKKEILAKQNELLTEKRIIDRKNIELENLSKETEKLQKEKEHFLIEIATLQNKIQSISSQKISITVSVLEDLRKKVKKNEPFYHSFILLQKKVVENIPKIQQKIEDFGNRIQKGMILIENLKKEVLTLQYSKEYHQKINTEITHLHTEIQQHIEKSTQINLEINTFFHQKKQIEQEIFQNEQTQNSIQTKKNEEQQLSKLQLLVKEFKEKIAESIGPLISTEASLLFSQLTKGRYESIRLDNEYDFWVTDNGKEFPLRRFSGGEIDLANFCLRIALTKAISEINGSPLVGFLAFDEIFGSQDAERRQEVIMALHSLQGQFRQIYVISHIEEVKELFPQLLHVNLGKLGSEVAWL